MHSPIASAQNKWVKLYRSLEKRKSREETGLLPLEGPRLVRDSLAAGAQPEAILFRDDVDLTSIDLPAGLTQNAEICTIESRLFDQTAYTETPQGILAIVRKPKHALADALSGELPLVLIVDGVQDPGNLGTILRSAAAAGVTGVVLLSGTVDLGNPKTLRSAMGANFLLSIAECSHDELLHEILIHGIDLLSTAAYAILPYHGYDYNKPVAIIIGNEGSGISPQLSAACNASVTIPLARNVESLNAAIATSVVLFEAARSRSAKPHAAE